MRTITIYKEGEVLSSWNGSNFTYEKKKLSGAAFKVTAGADIYKALTRSDYLIIPTLKTTIDNTDYTIIGTLDTHPEIPENILE